MTKRLCPEDCAYRSKLAPFCGYCMKNILEEREAMKRESYRQQESADIRQAGSIWSRYRKEDHGT